MIFKDRSAALLGECLYRNILPVTINFFLVADEDATLATLLLEQIVGRCNSPLFCIEVAIYFITLEFGCKPAMCPVRKAVYFVSIGRVLGKLDRAVRLAYGQNPSTQNNSCS
jgi:hypothetical protein